MEEGFTSHSEYLPLDKVLIMPVEEAFMNPAKVEAEWRVLNFTAKPDLNKARKEYSAFRKILEGTGAGVNTFSRGDSLTLDALYARDASIVTNHGVILCNMGKDQRRAEPGNHKKTYEAFEIPILGRIESPGTLEGGDVAWIGTNTLAVGHSYRTNLAGIEQLKGLLEPFGIEVIVAQLPHFRGPSDVFHLMSILSPLDKDLAAIYSPLMPIAFRNHLLEMGYDFVEIPEEEFDSQGCNILATGPRQCVVPKGNPITEKALRDAGCKVTAYSGEEISVKGGGGPTCLTRPLRRRQ